MLCVFVFALCLIVGMLLSVRLYCVSCVLPCYVLWFDVFVVACCFVCLYVVGCVLMYVCDSLLFSWYVVFVSSFRA